MSSQSRVNKGARRLDDVVPQWRTCLSMEEVTALPEILEQLFGSVSHGCSSLGLKTRRDMQKHAFDVIHDPNTADGPGEFQSIHERWSAKIVADH